LIFLTVSEVLLVSAIYFGSLDYFLSFTITAKLAKLASII